jgi:hypothetical protein
VYCDVDMLIVDVLDERVASSEYRYSAGNAMGIVVVVDREQVECCATASYGYLSHELHIVKYTRAQCWVIGDEPYLSHTAYFLSRLQVQRRLAT